MHCLTPFGYFRKEADPAVPVKKLRDAITRQVAKQAKQVAGGGAGAGGRRGGSSAGKSGPVVSQRTMQQIILSTHFDTKDISAKNLMRPAGEVLASGAVVFVRASGTHPGSFQSTPLPEQGGRGAQRGDSSKRAARGVASTASSSSASSTRVDSLSDLSASLVHHLGFQRAVVPSTAASAIRAGARGIGAWGSAATGRAGSTGNVVSGGGRVRDHDSGGEGEGGGPEDEEEDDDDGDDSDGWEDEDDVMRPPSEGEDAEEPIEPIDGGLAEDGDDDSEDNCENGSSGSESEEGRLAEDRRDATRKERAALTRRAPQTRKVGGGGGVKRTRPVPAALTGDGMSPSHDNDTLGCETELLHTLVPPLYGEETKTDGTRGGRSGGSVDSDDPDGVEEHDNRAHGGRAAARRSASIDTFKPRPSLLKALLPRTVQLPGPSLPDNIRAWTVDDVQTWLVHYMGGLPAPVVESLGRLTGSQLMAVTKVRLRDDFGVRNNLFITKILLELRAQRTRGGVLPHSGGEVDVCFWSVEDVALWVRESCEVSDEDAQLFAMASVDGDMLCALTEDDLADDLGVSDADTRLRILSGAADLRRSSRRWVRFYGGEADDDDGDAPVVPEDEDLVDDPDRIKNIEAQVERLERTIGDVGRGRQLADTTDFAAIGAGHEWASGFAKDTLGFVKGGGSAESAGSAVGGTHVSSSNAEGVQGSSRAVPESVKWCTAGGMSFELDPAFWRRLVAICDALDHAGVSIIEVSAFIEVARVRVCVYLLLLCISVCGPTSVFLVSRSQYNIMPYTHCSLYIHLDPAPCPVCW